jgi:hypothetical protein
MTIEERTTSNANVIANAFYYEYLKTRVRPVNKKAFIVEGKYYKYFYNAAEMFQQRSGFDPVKFVLSQFAKYTKLYPAQLCKEKAWKAFEEYKVLLKEDKTEEDILLDEIKQGEHLLKGKTVKEFFDNPTNQYNLIVGKINHIRLFCFSNEFTYLYEDIEHKMDKKININIMKSRVLAYPKVISCIQGILKEDFNCQG